MTASPQRAGLVASRRSERSFCIASKVNGAPFNLPAANAVALAMLERRRELGILKAVGYTSGTVLSEVMIENGVIGGIGALMAMLLATGAITLLGSFLFNIAFSVSTLIVIGLIGGSALLAMLTAALVAWGSTRVRPLEVLRYE